MALFKFLCPLSRNNSHLASWYAVTLKSFRSHNERHRFWVSSQLISFDLGAYFRFNIQPHCFSPVQVPSRMSSLKEEGKYVRTVQESRRMTSYHYRNNCPHITEHLLTSSVAAKKAWYHKTKLQSLLLRATRTTGCSNTVSIKHSKLFLSHTIPSISSGSTSVENSGQSKVRITNHTLTSTALVPGSMEGQTRNHPSS